MKAWGSDSTAEYGQGAGAGMYMLKINAKFKLYYRVIYMQRGKESG